MKQLLTWIVLPIAAYCQERSDLFTFSEKESDFLRHLEVDIEAEESFDETQGLSLLEIDESDESLIPWSTEDLAIEEFADPREGRVVEVRQEEFEDVFAYEVPSYREGIACEPTYEKVSEERKRLFHRPKVVELARGNRKE